MMEAAMDLIRRMPPTHSEEALAGLVALLPAHSQELLSRVDQPLRIALDDEQDKQFLLCDYNRDGDSYRSPWSSRYFPPLEDGAQPSEKLRKMEVEANEVFAIYRDQYYEGGISSVYMWEPESGEGFVACFLIKKDGSKSADGRRGHLQHGLWDAIHVIEVGEEDEGLSHYCLTSTVMLSLSSDTMVSGTFSLAGSITRQGNLGSKLPSSSLSWLSNQSVVAPQMEADLAVVDGHMTNMGRMVEEMENKLRNGLDQVYFGKTKEVVFTLREPLGVLSASSYAGQSLQQTIMNDMNRHR